MSVHRFGFLALIALLLVPGCSKDGDDVTNIINSLFRGSLNVTADGGGAFGGPGASAGNGGNLVVSSGHNLLVGVNAPPLAPPLPAAPTTGTPVVSWTDDQTIDTGNAILNGNVTAATTGFAATLTVTTGDLVINGTLTGADNGIFETPLVLDVPAGTVWISGTIRTGRVDGVNNGDEGAPVEIHALRIIFTGTIDARGENGGAGFGGDGGFLTFDTEGIGTGPTSQILAGGTINLSGGNATGPNPLGGDAGDFLSYGTVASTGAIHISGTQFTFTGGSANGSGVVTGGNGGDLDLQGDAGVFFNGAYSGAGGDATATGGDAQGGEGGTLFVNDLAIVDSGPVAIFGAVNVSGGSANGGSTVNAAGGNAGTFDARSGSDVNLGGGTFLHRGGVSTGSGGHGALASFSTGELAGESGDIYFDALLDVSDGSGGETVASATAGFIDFDTIQGDIQISGTLISNGGHGSNDADITSGPSEGGTIAAGCGPGGGSITIRATIRANGGSDSNGADDNDGAAGGLIQFLIASSSGSIYLDPGSLLQADGGNAAGVSPAPFGGDGGQIQLLTGGGSIVEGMIGGNISMRGSVAARGGAGLALVGSFGGFGGEILVDSDSLFSVGGGADGRGGDITLHVGAIIDVSGGSAGSGGDALNDGILFSVTSPVAVTLDSDGIDSDDPGENGIVRNFGTIIARGVGPGSIGGDVLFDGLDSSLNPGPLPGFLDLTGAAQLGDFLSQ